MKHLDKTNWERVKFGDVARSLNSTVRDPQAAGFERVVGMEHIDSGSLHIRSWGNIADGTTFTRTFQPGQVLFGKRRAYQRKAAVANFAGLCSGDILVLEAKKDRLLPELLPFLVHSDGFFDHAVRTSAGSLSPRTKFQDLADHEFLLPPRDQQARLAELLWAADEVGEAYQSAVEATKATKYTYIREFVAAERTSRNWLPLADVSDLVGGYAFKSDLFSSEPTGAQVLKISNVGVNGFNLLKSPAYISDAKCDKRFWLDDGEIVISLTGSNGKRDFGFAVLNQTGNRYLVNQRLAIVRANPNLISNAFLLLMMKHDVFLDKFHQNAIGTANQANVSMKDMGKILLPVPPMNEQVKLVKIIEGLNLAIESSQMAIAELTTLKETLMNQIFFA